MGAAPVTRRAPYPTRAMFSRSLGSRSHGRSLSAWLASLLLTLLAACSHTRPGPSWDELRTAAEADLERRFCDATPPHVPRAALDGVVYITDLRRRQRATAFAISPQHLMTAAHVVDEEELDDERCATLTVDHRVTRVRVVAMGDESAPHGDWAVLEVIGYELSNVMSLHAAALVPDWEPEGDMPILLVGYAAGFGNDDDVDPAAPTPSIPARFVSDRDQEGDGPCWYATGAEVYLGGMSGGPAVWWNEETQRTEAVGVFSGYTFAENVLVRTAHLLGVPLWSERERSAQIAFMVHRLPVEVLDELGLVPQD